MAWLDEGWILAAVADADLTASRITNVLAAASRRVAMEVGFLICFDQLQTHIRRVSFLCLFPGAGVGAVGPQTEQCAGELSREIHSSPAVFAFGNRKVGRRYRELKARCS
jgi:hypothetical protein